MMVTVDANRRVLLPNVKPGESFDVSLADGKYVLAPMLGSSSRTSAEELIRRARAIRWQTHLSPEEVREAVSKGRR